MDKIQPVPMTTITGFYNPHEYPVLLDVTPLGLRLQVGPKMRVGRTYTEVVDGKRLQRVIRYNDPRLEEFCGPLKLVVERGPEPVPIVFLPDSTKNAPEATAAAFSGTSSFKVDSSGSVIGAEKIVARPNTQPAASSGIQAYSVQEAIAKGIIGKPPAHLLHDEPAEVIRTTKPEVKPRPAPPVSSTPAPTPPTPPAPPAPPASVIRGDPALDPDAPSEGDDDSQFDLAETLVTDLGKIPLPRTDVVPPPPPSVPPPPTAELPTAPKPRRRRAAVDEVQSSAIPSASPVEAPLPAPNV